jgi:hypothetical protein
MHFLTLALDFYGQTAPSTYSVEGWVASRASLDALKKGKITSLLGIKLQ